MCQSLKLAVRAPQRVVICLHQSVADKNRAKKGREDGLKVLLAIILYNRRLALSKQCHLYIFKVLSFLPSFRMFWKVPLLQMFI